MTPLLRTLLLALAFLGGSLWAGSRAWSAPSVQAVAQSSDDEGADDEGEDRDDDLDDGSEADDSEDN